MCYQEIDVPFELFTNSLAIFRLEKSFSVSLRFISCKCLGTLEFFSDIFTAQLDATSQTFLTATSKWFSLIRPNAIEATNAAACSALFLFFSLFKKNEKLKFDFMRITHKKSFELLREICHKKDLVQSIL